MGVPHVTSFCWCLPLETGARIIGIMHLIASLIVMLVCSIFAESARALVGTVEDAGDGLYSTWYAVAVGGALLSLLHAALAVTLLYSVHKRSAAGLRAWLCGAAALAAAALLLALVSAGRRGLSDASSASPGDIFLSVFEGVLFFGFLAYCILCVYSYYLMLKSSEDMEGPNKTEY